MSINLSVNLNKVALLRNSRGGANPSPEVAAKACIRAGANGITLHWREDNRHARAADVRAVAALCRDLGAEFNLEGDDREELISLALDLAPAQYTLVPVIPGEITSDHGWDLPRDQKRIAPVIRRAKERGIRVSLFMDPNEGAMEHAAETGADRVELYTEPYASAFDTARQGEELARVARAAAAAEARGLGVNAGHDLDLENLPFLARQVPQIREVSIGHAIVADALYLGFEEAVRRYREAAAGRDVAFPETA